MIGATPSPEGMVTLVGWVDALRPDWHKDALCREHLHLDFIGYGRDRATRQACLQVCGRCAVRPECLAYALDDPDLVGVWGGTDAAARRAIRRNRRMTEAGNAA